jgi:hypothetical protein
MPSSENSGGRISRSYAPGQCSREPAALHWERRTHKRGAAARLKRTILVDRTFHQLCPGDGSCRCGIFCMEIRGYRAGTSQCVERRRVAGLPAIHIVCSNRPHSGLRSRPDVDRRDHRLRQCLSLRRCGGSWIFHFHYYGQEKAAAVKSYPAGCCCVMQCSAPSPQMKSRQ